MAYNRLSTKKVKEICRLLEENELSIRRIADTVGVHVSDVYRILHKGAHKDISSRYRIDLYEPKDKKYDGARYSSEQIHKVCELIEQNELKISEIFRETGVSVETIRLLAKDQIHKDITQYYDFSAFNRRYKRKHAKKGTIQFPKRSRTSEATIHEICKLLEEGTLPITEIARRVGVNYSVPYGIKHYGAHRDISLQYDIDNHPAIKEHYAPVVFRRLKDYEVHEICKLLEKNLTVLQIHEKTKIATSIIWRIKERKTYHSITKQYKF